MPSKKTRTPLEAGRVYHIYNRGNNYQNVFFNDQDYILFLERFSFYLSGFCKVYAYTLIPNHYHFLLRLNGDLSPNEFGNQYMKFILSYTNKTNFKKGRNGSLFLNIFKRILIDDESYLKRLIFYIHYNPEKHEIVEDFRTYKFSSYLAFLSGKKSKLSREEVIEYFGDRNDTIEYHNHLHDEKVIRKFVIEE